MLNPQQDFVTPPPPSEFDPIDPLEEAKEQSQAVTGEIQNASAPIWEVQDNGPNHLAVSGLSDKPGVLFLNEMFYPGWKASRVGFESPIENVNYFFRGVELPAGCDVGEFYYDP
mgnify:CR=1 FL=1